MGTYDKQEKSVLQKGASAGEEGHEDYQDGLEHDEVESPVDQVDVQVTYDVRELVLPPQPQGEAKHCQSEALWRAPITSNKCGSYAGTVDWQEG